MFCSYECRSAIYRDIKPAGFYKHQNATELHPHLMQQQSSKVKNFRSCKAQRKTIFDFDFAQPNDLLKGLNQLECLYGLNAPNFSFTVLRGASENDLDDTARESHLVSIWMWNSMFLLSMGFRREGDAIPLFGSLINHSCDPNVQTILVDNEVVYMVIKPLKEGEQLFISYW